MVMERFQSVASQLMNQVEHETLRDNAPRILIFFPSQRIIRLGGAVDDDSCNLIVAQLLWLDASDAKQVSCYLFLLSISLPLVYSTYFSPLIFFKRTGHYDLRELPRWFCDRWHGSV